LASFNNFLYKKKLRFIINNNIDTTRLTGLIYERDLNIINYLDWFMGYVPSTSSLAMLGFKNHNILGYIILSEHL
jgi:hypothetical protein